MEPVPCFGDQDQEAHGIKSAAVYAGISWALQIPKNEICVRIIVKKKQP